MVMDFFAPWCKACPAAAQELEKLATGDYSDSCVFLLVCVDGDAEAAHKWASENGIQRCHVAIVDDDDLPEAYGVSGLPHHVLIAPNGKVERNYEVALPGDLADVLRTGNATEAHDNTAPVSRISKEFRALEKTDPLLMENPRRFVMFPIQYPAIWEMYKVSRELRTKSERGVLTRRRKKMKQSTRNCKSNRPRSNRTDAKRSQMKRRQKSKKRRKLQNPPQNLRPRKQMRQRMKSPKSPHHSEMVARLINTLGLRR